MCPYDKRLHAMVVFLEKLDFNAIEDEESILNVVECTLDTCVSICNECKHRYEYMYFNAIQNKHGLYNKDLLLKMWQVYVE